MQTKPIRVLHVITRLIVGGAQENTIFTALMLNSSRYRVDVVCGPQAGAEGSLHDEYINQGGNLIIIPELVREISPVKDLAAFWKLYNIIKKGRYDIVHTHSSKAGIVGRLAAKLANVPVIVHTVHGWSFHAYMSKVTRTAFVVLEKIAARMSNKLIVVTKLDIRKGLHAGIGRKKDYILIRSSILLDKFEPNKYSKDRIRNELGIPAESFVVGNVGRLSKQKNPLLWVRVANIIHAQYSNTKFLMVGDGNLRTEVEKLINELGLRDGFIITGLKRNVPELLSAMDVFLLTSLWEGLPRVIPQAMAMGIPVVATKADGNAEIIQHGVSGFLGEPSDAEKLAEYCLRLKDDIQLRQHFVKRGMEIVREEYDLQKMVDTIDNLYVELIAKKN